MDTTWINREEYPFSSHYMELDGNKIHYLDEGNGPVFLMVHGIPEWSFTYRDLIKRLSVSYRCVIMDNLGFGLSDKPVNADYSHRAHTERLTRFIEKLKLDQIHLFVHDHGGPIGLGFATEFPEKIKTITLSQTWMWPLQDTSFYKPLYYLSGKIGKYLYLKKNFSVNYMLPKSYADKRKLTKEIHAHYTRPFPTPESRHGIHQMMLEMLRGKSWFQYLWERRGFIENKPVLILWAVKDRFFPENEFGKKWTDNLKNYEFVRLHDSGHFIQEEAHIEVCDAVQGFLFQH